MNMLDVLQQELEAEYRTTQQFLKMYPAGKDTYAPHPKSMKLGHLATHIVEIFSWPGGILQTDNMDLASTPPPAILSTPEALLEQATKNYEYSMQALRTATEADLKDTWALKHGDQVLAEWDKYSALRHSLNQVTHHRAQLGVYYRLNDLPLPGSYGPTADNNHF